MLHSHEWSKNERVCEFRSYNNFKHLKIILLENTVDCTLSVVQVSVISGCSGLHVLLENTMDCTLSKLNNSAYFLYY